MTRVLLGGILRFAIRIANTVSAGGSTRVGMCCGIAVMIWSASVPGSIAADQPASSPGYQDSEKPDSGQVDSEPAETVVWDFGRRCDRDFNDWPDAWQRSEEVGYPKYVAVTMPGHDADLEALAQRVDASLVGIWQPIRRWMPSLPYLPPSVSDAVVDRYLCVEMDGGQFKAQSPKQPANRMYQYGFSADVMTQGLRYDTARAELVFLDDNDRELAVYSTAKIGGTTPWTKLALDLVRPPMATSAMMIRVWVQRSEDGLEDIRGTIGFDNLRVRRFPQLHVTTDIATGVYPVGRPVQTRAKIMGLPSGDSQIEFTLYDSDDRPQQSRLMTIGHDVQATDAPREADSVDELDPEVTWTLTPPEPGFYRVSASIVGSESSTLSTDVTFVVVDPTLGGTIASPTPRGPFGWTMVGGDHGMTPRDLATWLTSLGVSWVKYPCWLHPEDTEMAEATASTLAKLQESGMQVVGMLDTPPESQQFKYELRGRRDLVASQLFRDATVWQPLLEPVMTRLTLKVRTWQLGSERDHSFLGRPRLRESIDQITTGLQGFGQPIDVAISWPWSEEELDVGETSWQAVVRSSDPPLAAHELDAFLEVGEKRSRDEGPRTWLLIDPIDQQQYDRDARIRDLVLRMATIRGHRVQAAFVSNPRDADQGLLRTDGRPDELLLPWRTTSWLLGNLRRSGSLKLPSGASNTVFMGDDRAVLMMWSPEPTVEKIYLGENVKMIDVWGKATDLPVQSDAFQPTQHIPVGPLPIFLVGADPSLLAFRMSVRIEPSQLDSLLGRVQSLRVQFANPLRESLAGTLRVVAPETWSFDQPSRQWEASANRSVTEAFDVVLSNTAKVGLYDVPLQFELDTVPPKLISVHRQIKIGPEGLELKVTTRLLRGEEMRVQIEITNRSAQAVAYDCLLFPPPGRQYQRRFVAIGPGETVQREIFWPNGRELVGRQMLLRAEEQDGIRVLNVPVEVRP